MGLIILGVTIWFRPPLLSTSVFSAHYTGVDGSYALQVEKPLGLPARFYITLPKPLDNRYQWFVVDVRREVVALLDQPPSNTTWLGILPAIKRGHWTGLDLEMREIDGKEWHIAFSAQQISFTNGDHTIELTY